jgi:transglutaminase-like putative cysteine protease
VKLLPIFLLLLAGFCANPASAEPKELLPPSGSYPIVKRIHFGFTVQNPSAKAISNADLWAYGPVKQTSTQWVRRLSASEPYELAVDEYGNQILHFRFKDLPPFSNRVVVVRAELAMSDVPNRLSSVGEGAFLKPERYIESDDKGMLSLAQMLKGASTEESARKAYQWVARNIRSEAYIADDRGAVWALANRRGDCTEFSYLLAAIIRANGIPARVLGGYVYPESAVLRGTDYHNWAEFYVDGAWQLADSQRKVFMDKPSNYIAMRILGPSTLNALGAFHRFHAMGAGIKVTMN